MTRDWSSLQKKKLAVRAMKNAMKESLSAKNVIINHSVVTTVKNVAQEVLQENLSERDLKTMKSRQDAVFREETMKKETKRNLLAEDHSIKTNVKNVAQEVLQEDLSASVSTVTTSVRHEAAAGVIAEKKTLSLTVHAPLARFA